jgi:prepilin-type N-terminal cleavage/methylation domain-containing protein
VFYAGFTLAELLVAITILLILAALLLPALLRGQERALSAKCISNLKQVGMAATSYASENNMKWLIFDVGSSTWDKILLRGGYLSSSNSVFCPSWNPKTTLISERMA